MDDLYEILGVAIDAAREDIKAAFKKLASVYHPDKNPGNENCKAKFQKIQQAYAVLGNPKTRETYDKTGRVTPPPSKDALVKQEISALFLQLVDKHPNLSQTRILPELKRAVQSGIKDLKRNITELTRKSAKFENLLGRIKPATEETSDIFTYALEGQVANLGSKIESVTEQMELGEAVLEFLENFNEDLSDLVLDSERSTDTYIFDLGTQS